MAEDDRQRGDELGVATKRRTERKLKKPKLYKVLLHNDDYTTMEFVVFVLQGIFHHPEAEAVQIMLHVHNNGVGVAGIYPYDVAEVKVKTVTDLAEQNDFPLLTTLEPE